MINGKTSTDDSGASESPMRYDIYTVVSGDTLSKIAKHYYGDASKWREIHEANKDQISNPDHIEVGQVIQVPLL